MDAYRQRHHSALHGWCQSAGFGACVCGRVTVEEAEVWVTTGWEGGEMEGVSK